MTLVLAASFILGTALTASAVEITANGSFDFTWGWYTNKTLFDNNEINRAVGAAGNNPEVFDARQRERLQVNFIASENVQGVIYFEIGETVWGGGNNGANVGRGSGGAAGTDGVAVEVRRAYIDFNVPNTDLLFRVGLQGLALPSSVVGNPVLGSSGTDMAAVVGVYTINDMVTVGALWGRPWNTWQFNDLNETFIRSVRAHHGFRRGNHCQRQLTDALRQLGAGNGTNSFRHPVRQQRRLNRAGPALPATTRS